MCTRDITSGSMRLFGEDQIPPNLSLTGTSAKVVRRATTMKRIPFHRSCIDSLLATDYVRNSRLIKCRAINVSFFANSWKLNRATFQHVIDWYRKVLMQRRTFVNDVLKYSSYVANDVQRYKVACKLPGDRVRCFHLAIRHKAHVVDRCVSRIHNFFLLFYR